MMDTRLRSFVPALALAVALVAGACSSGGGGSTGGESPTPAGDPSTDKLAQIQARGTLVGYFEPEFPPQSFAVEGATRPADTRCAEDQLTAAEVDGYDIRTTVLVAEALGVEACFVTPTWTEVTAGNWGDRFDIVYGSGSINSDRMQRLWMTQPYYAVPVSFFVREDSPYQAPSDLDGKTIGTCASCSQELYLRGQLEIPGVVIEPTVADPQIVTFQIETPGLRALARGKVEGFLAADPVGQGQIDEGLPLRRLDPPAFTYYPSGFVDKSSGLSVAAFVDRVNEVILTALTDGTLPSLSQEWFGTDYASAAAAFDIQAIGQGEVA
jgi:polar amino acid transport system substrate-binding protein